MCHDLILFSQEFWKTTQAQIVIPRRSLLQPTRTRGEIASPATIPNCLLLLNLPKPARTREQKSFSNLDVAHLHRREILPVPALNLVLIGPLILEHGHFFRSPLLDDLPGHTSLLCFCANKDLLVPMDREDIAKTDLLSHLA